MQNRSWQQKIDSVDFFARSLGLEAASLSCHGRDHRRALLVQMDKFLPWIRDINWSSRFETERLAQWLQSRMLSTAATIWQSRNHQYSWRFGRRQAHISIIKGLSLSYMYPKFTAPISSSYPPYYDGYRYNSSCKWLAGEKYVSRWTKDLWRNAIQ